MAWKLSFPAIKKMTVANRKQWDGRSHLNGIVMCQSGNANQPLEQTGASDMKITVDVDAFLSHLPKFH